MAFNLILLSVVVGLSVLNVQVSAANCYNNQPIANTGPTAAEVVTALTENNQLSFVCSGQFPPLSNTVATFNHGTLIYNVSRTDPTQPLQYCEGAFNDIISQCITGSNLYGGEWDLGDETYSIYAQNYPTNPLLPQDAGGPGNASPGSESAPAQQTTLTEVAPNGQTVTITFAPTIDPQYTSVTKAITTTTTSDGVPIPFIIGVGGLIWGIVGAVPPVPVFPPMTPAPVPSGGDTPNNPNDPSNPTITTTTSSSTKSTCTLATVAADFPWQWGTDGPIIPGASPTPPCAAQTVTANCAVCVLPCGSNDPACTPIPGCSAPTSTPAPDTSGYTCSGQCRGYVPDPNWCAANCAYCFNANNVC